MEVVLCVWIDIEVMCLMVLKVVWVMDVFGSWEVCIWVYMVKVMVLECMCCIIDEVIQVYGVMGVFQWMLFVQMYISQCILCFVDGFDEVYYFVVGWNEVMWYFDEV